MSNTFEGGRPVRRQIVVADTDASTVTSMLDMSLVVAADGSTISLDLGVGVIILDKAAARKLAESLSGAVNSACKLSKASKARAST